MARLRRISGMALGALSFVYLIFVLNTVQALSILVFPFSRRSFRAINRWCARSIWGLWVIMAEIHGGIDVRFTGDKPVLRANALVLPNHQSMADVLVLMCLAWRCRRLGDMKWFVKDIVKWCPGFGWGMKFLDCLFVKRNWSVDKAGIERLFAKFRTERIPIFLVSFLEGTRKTEQKLQTAQTFAKARGLHVPHHVLVPRTKGFVATMVGLRDHLDVVYDVTIGYPEGVPTLVQLFEGKVRRIEVNLRVFRAADLPLSADDLEVWSRARFDEKDALLARFSSEHTFPGPRCAEGIRATDWFRPESRRAAVASADPSEEAARSS